MADRIYKYPLSSPAEYRYDGEGAGMPVYALDMPAPAVPLHVGVQHGDIVVWAKVGAEYDAPLVARTFDIYATGEALRADSGEHLGTVQIESLVYHVYMRQEGV